MAERSKNSPKQCRYCGVVISKAGGVCQRKACMQKSKENSAQHQPKAPLKKCQASNCNNLFSVSLKRNYCRAKECSRRREELDANELEEMRAIIEEELVKEKDRGQPGLLEEALEQPKGESVGPESVDVVEYIQEHSKALKLAIKHIRSCCPIFICYCCGMWLFDSDLKWTPVAQHNITKPYRAVQTFEWIEGIENLVGEKQAKRQGTVYSLVTSCFHCISNPIRNFCPTGVRPPELHTINFKEQTLLSLVRFNCFMELPQGSLTFFHSKGNKSVGRVDLNGLFGLLHIPSATPDNEKIIAALKWLIKKQSTLSTISVPTRDHRKLLPPCHLYNECQRSAKHCPGCHHSARTPRQSNLFDGQDPK